MVVKANKKLSIASHERKNEHKTKYRNLWKKQRKRELNEKETAKK